MNNFRRLKAAVSGSKGKLSLVFVCEPNPSLQDINHLKVKLVEMGPRFGKGLYWFPDADNVRIEYAPSSLINP